MNAFKIISLIAFVSLCFACKEDSKETGPKGHALNQKTKAPESKTLTNKLDTSKSVANILLGQKAIEFSLQNLDGKTVSLSDYKGKTVVLEWFNPQCPFVVAAHEKGSLIKTAERHQKEGIVWLAINSGAKGKQGNALDVNVSAKSKWNLSHEILRDEDGKIGRLYGATNTPQMVIVGKDGLIKYAGAIDNSRDGEGQSPEGGTLINFVDEALKDIAAGKAVRTPYKKPYGCSVKYAS